MTVKKLWLYKVKKVEALENMILKVEFIDNVIKLYDVKKLMNKWKVFENLKDIELFKKVKVDQGGYGISWNDEIDIACNELWENGIKE